VVAVSVLGTTVGASAVVPTADSPGVAAAKRQLAAWVQPAVTISKSILAAPLPKTPPTGKKVFYIDNTIPNSTRVWNGFSAAAAVLGWAPTRLSYNTQGEAVGLVSQALSQGANYILVSGVSQTILQPALDAARAANVPVFERGGLDVPQGPANWIFSQTAGPELYANQGKAAADWVTVTRNGKATTLLMAATGLGALKTFNDVFQTEYAKNCTGCGITVLDNPTADVSNGGMVTNAVAYIRAHPEVTNVVFPLGSAAFNWPAAAANAGLTNVVMSTSSASDGNLKFIAAGQQAETTQWGLEQGGWVIIDAMARQSLGMSLKPNWAAAMPLLVNTIANTTVNTQSFAGGPNYTGQFKQVWHRG
jgi:ribose transport system substrate-binding protein